MMKNPKLKSTGQRFKNFKKYVWFIVFFTLPIVFILFGYFTLWSLDYYAMLLGGGSSSSLADWKSRRENPEEAIILPWLLSLFFVVLYSFVFAIRKKFKITSKSYSVIFWIFITIYFVIFGGLALLNIKTIIFDHPDKKTVAVISGEYLVDLSGEYLKDKNAIYYWAPGQPDGTGV